MPSLGILIKSGIDILEKPCIQQNCTPKNTGKSQTLKIQATLFPDH